MRWHRLLPHWLIWLVGLLGRRDPLSVFGVWGSLALAAACALAGLPPAAAEPLAPLSSSAAQAQPTSAGTAAPPPAAAAAPTPPEVPVMVANREVAVLRAVFLGVGPLQRARRAETVLQELLARAVDGQVAVQVEPQGHALLIDGELVLVLTPGDLDPLRVQNLAQASQATRAALQRALAESREARDLRRLMQGAGLSALATAAFALAALLMRRLRRWAGAHLVQRLVPSGGVRVAGAQLLQAERLAAALLTLLRALSALVVFVLGYQWLSFVLRQFPYTRPWGEGLTAFLLRIAGELGHSALQALPDLAIAVLIFLIARGVIALARPFFSRVQASGVSSGGWLDADTARPTQRLFGIGVTLFALVMAYPYLPGAGSEAFKGMSLLIGLMVTVGGSGLFGQAASGLILMYSRTLRVGEYVRIADHEGTVTEMGAFTLRIRTGLGEEVTLPNAMALGTATKNYSRTVRGSGYVVDTVVTIGYDTPWRQVQEMLLQAARRTPGVLAEPPPQVFNTALSDFYPEYRLVCQASPTLPRPRAEVLSLLHAHIQDVFNENGVQIMSPHYLGDPASPKLVPREKPAADRAVRG